MRDEINVAHEVIVWLIPPWPSPRFLLLEILKTMPLRVPNPKPRQLKILRINSPKRLKTSPHIPHTITFCTHIIYGPRVARPSKKAFRRNRYWESYLMQLEVIYMEALESSGLFQRKVLNSTKAKGVLTAWL